MSDLRIMSYAEPRWGSKVAGMVTLHKDNQARYFIDNVGVVDVRVIDLFTELACVSGTTHYVLTAFFRQLDQRAIPESNRPVE